MTWLGGQVGDTATCILAPNPGPMTLEGTNTWIIRASLSSRALLVDPGPDLVEHRDAVVRHLRDHDLTVTQIVLTHGHKDHAESARAMHEITHAPVVALDPMQQLGSEGISDGDIIDVDGLIIRILTTPGHTSDSISLLIESDRALLTGDTILGRGTTLIAHPDRRLADYLASLERIQHEVEVTQRVLRILPGHGAVVDDPAAVLAFHAQHREMRLGQVAAVRARVLAVDPTLNESELADAIVDEVYRDVPSLLKRAAVVNVLAQLVYLEQREGR